MHFPEGTFTIFLISKTLFNFFIPYVTYFKLKILYLKRAILKVLDTETDFRQIFSTDNVPDKKGLGQPACPKEWKKYEEGNE
jgi:hypothetical protein